MKQICLLDKQLKRRCSDLRYTAKMMMMMMIEAVEKRGKREEEEEGKKGLKNHHRCARLSLYSFSNLSPARLRNEQLTYRQILSPASIRA